MSKESRAQWHAINSVADLAELLEAALNDPERTRRRRIHEMACALAAEGDERRHFTDDECRRLNEAARRMVDDCDAMLREEPESDG